MKTHIRLKVSPRHARAIVCGSPERARYISRFLVKPKTLAQNREYHSYLGVHSGTPILVTSHGVGSAGAAICFQEMIDAGARIMIRIGTAGGLYGAAKIGDIVIPTAAIRKDGVSRAMVPPAFPAVADLGLTHALVALSQERRNAARRGVILTSDLFYPGVLDNELRLYARAGAIAVEMECAALFIVSQLRKVRAAAMLVLDGNPIKQAAGRAGQYDPDPKRLETSVAECVQTALAALTAA